MNKVIAFFLSLLLLVSTSGIAYAQHFCGEYQMMAKVTLGTQQLSCGIALEDHCEGEEDQEHNCCENQYTQIDIDDNFASSQSDSIIIPTFVKAFVTVFILPSRFQEVKKTRFEHQYHAPPLIKNIPILYETFLI